MTRFHSSKFGCDREILLSLSDVEQGTVIEARARVLERGCGLQEGLKIRLFQCDEFEIRRLPDRYREWIVRIVEESLKNRDVCVFVVHDLVDQLS
jgi:hypothetical protein